MTKGEEFMQKLEMYLSTRDTIRSFSMADECDSMGNVIEGYNRSKNELAGLINEIYKRANHSHDDLAKRIRTLRG